MECMYTKTLLVHSEWTESGFDYTLEYINLANCRRNALAPSYIRNTVGMVK